MHPLALLASIMLVFVLVGALVRSRTTSPIPGVGRAQWQHLLTIARGDEAAARSMIEGEQKRRPGSTAAEACRRVIARYERDNR